MAEGQDREGRPVRVQTTHGALEGTLRVMPRVRTLDEVNLSGQRFLHVDVEPGSISTAAFEPGPLDIQKDSILFLTETSDCRATGDLRVERSHFVRTAVRLKIGDFDIRGFLHIRGLRDPVMWFGQVRHPFIALTAASVVGPETEFATAFIAINLRHVVAAQSLTIAEEDDETIERVETTAVSGD